MSRIHILDPLVADQIAAGEVVERPASVVKELVENSLDAQAQHLEVHVEDGGKRQIVVQDDGIGMDPDDLRLSVRRHATSKIVALDDLAQSTALGFRGEALAAISAVSRTHLLSRPRGEPYGFQLRIDGGHVGELQPAPMAEGTIIRVEDIFFNVPARWKLLKSDHAELGAIQLLMQHYAIGYADVAMTLGHAERVLWHTSGSGQVSEVVCQLFGSDIQDCLLPVRYEQDGLAIIGYVCPAAFNRGTRQGQSLYINRRWVTNWVLRNAVEEAFRPQMPDRRYPYFWLFVTLNGSEVDPNAHPTKAEVRLEHERFIAGKLYHVVQKSLADHSASAPLGVSSLQTVTSAVYAPQEEQTPLAQMKWSPDSVSEPSNTWPVLHDEYRALIPLAQWQAKYIIAQGPLGLYLIDQHAAHERVYYEQFRRKGQDVLIAQPLLIPYTYTCLPGEWSKWREYQTMFEEMGFDITEVGGTTLMIRALPQGLVEPSESGGIIRTVLESLADGEPHHGHPIFWTQEAKYALAACKAAIKAYRILTMEEMQALLTMMATVEDPRGCPHGRPTILHMTLEEVDRRFGRKG